MLPGVPRACLDETCVAPSDRQAPLVNRRPHCATHSRVVFTTHVRVVFTTQINLGADQLPDVVSGSLAVGGMFPAGEGASELSVSFLRLRWR